MAVRKTRARGASTRHEDFYTRLRERVAGWAQKGKINARYRDYVLALPDLFHLVVKLLLDRRVDATSKAVLGAAIAWAVAPFDLMPDVLGPLGVLDDLLVLALALDFMLDRTPREVVEEHWAGSGDVFVIIRTILDRADEWMGRGLYQRVRSLVAPERAPAAPAATPGPRRRTTARKTASRKTAGTKATTRGATKPAAKAAPKRAATKASRGPKAAARRRSRPQA